MTLNMAFQGREQNELWKCGRTVVQVSADECLEMSGQDVKDFFKNQFSINDRRLRSNALHGSLSQQQMRDVFEGVCPVAGCAFVGLSTMATGDLLACEFAQGSHLALLLQASATHPTELIQLEHTFPRGNFFAGIVVDNLVMLEKVVRKMDAALEPTRLAPDRMKKAVEAYRSVHLPLNDKKAFLGVTQASFWGIELDGVAVSLRASSTRLWPLVMITMRVCALGVTPLGLLESMVGSF